MLELNKPFKGDLLQLLGFGICCIGVSFIMWVLVIRELSTFPFLYLPLEIIGSLIGIYLSNKGGGYINWYFGKRIYTKDDILLSDLIAKYKDTRLTLAIGIITLIIQIIAFLSAAHTFRFMSESLIDNVLGAFIFPLIFIGMLSVGVKYITAWWNIKKLTKSK